MVLQWSMAVGPLVTGVKEDMGLATYGLPLQGIHITGWTPRLQLVSDGKSRDAVLGQPLDQ